MDPRYETENRARRVRVGVLTALMGVALLAASVTGVSIARSGGGYREAMDLTINAVWFNAIVLGFGVVNAIPMFRPVRRILGRVPGMTALGGRLLPLEPYGMVAVFLVVSYGAGTLLPFAMADGWDALVTGGGFAKVALGITAAIMAPVATLGLAGLIAGNEGWGRMTERRLARMAAQG